MSIDFQGNKLSSNMKVEIQRKKWIKPATPTPLHLQKLKLSTFDQLVAQIFVQPVFYFDINGSETEVPGKLLNLEDSLSKVLTLYYPFAGRSDEDDQTLVSCQDQGVAFVVVKVDRKLDELAYGEYDTKVLFSALESLQTSNPLVLVQVNVFTCGGLAIGLRVSHKVGDIFTISNFMNAWATTCRLGTLDKVVPPSFRFSSLMPPPRSDFQLPKLWDVPDESPPPEINTAAPTPKYVLKRFIFTGEVIAKIRSSIPESYTRVQLAIAIITKSLTNIEQCKDNKALVIGQPMNFRSRTTLPIEENSCGNLVTIVLANCGQLDNGLLSWELPELAKFIKDSIHDVASEMREVKDWTELSAAVVKTYLKLEEQVKKGESVHVVTFTSWCRFSLYEVDFGWGTPTLVSTVPIIAANCTFLMDCKSDIGGIEALVCLEEQAMAIFQQQSDILEYASF